MLLPFFRLCRACLCRLDNSWQNLWCCWYDGRNTLCFVQAVLLTILTEVHRAASVPPTPPCPPPRACSWSYFFGIWFSFLYTKQKQANFFPSCLLYWQRQFSTIFFLASHSTFDLHIPHNFFGLAIYHVPEILCCVSHLVLASSRSCWRRTTQLSILAKSHDSLS